MKSALLFLTSVFLVCSSCVMDGKQSINFADKPPELFLAPPPHSQDYCRDSSGVDVVDLSTRVDVNFLEEMKDIGVHSVARYYAYTEPQTLTDGSIVGPQPSLPDKVISRAEVQMLKEFSMSSRSWPAGKDHHILRCRQRLCE